MSRRSNKRVSRRSNKRVSRRSNKRKQHGGYTANVDLGVISANNYGINLGNGMSVTVVSNTLCVNVYWLKELSLKSDLKTIKVLLFNGVPTLVETSTLKPKTSKDSDQGIRSHQMLAAEHATRVFETVGDFINENTIISGRYIYEVNNS